MVLINDCNDHYYLIESSMVYNFSLFTLLVFQDDNDYLFSGCCDDNNDDRYTHRHTTEALVILPNRVNYLTPTALSLVPGLSVSL